MNKKLALCLLLALTCRAQAQTYPWSSVALSGANAMVTGLYTLPGGADNVWIRTDVGGTYRYNSATSSWKPLNDTFPLERDGVNWADYYACDGFAVNPVATNTIYYAGGLSHGRAGALLKTTDGGVTWNKLTVPTALVQASSTSPAQASSINGNGLNRWAGERMAICPNDRNIILYGSRRTGLWRSTNAGETVNSATSWVQDTRIPVSTSTDDGDADYGVQCITFDPKMTGRVYCAVSLHGVYSSNDNGATWTYLGGSVRPQRLKVANNGTATTPGTVYYTTGDYDSTGNPVAMSVQRYENNAWSTFYPGASADGFYCGLAINPNDYKDVIVQQGAQSHDYPQGKIIRTRDGGANWTTIVGNPTVPATLTTEATWYGKPSPYRFSPADLAWDPADTTTYSHVRGGQWYCSNINASTTAWYQQEKGHEENVMLCLACPPAGAGTKDYELLEGSKDDRGLAWLAGTTNLGTFPDHSLTTDTAMGPLVRIAYCESSLSHMMRADSSVVGRSSDGGDSWIKDTAFPTGLKVMDLAVSGTLWQAGVVVCSNKALVSSPTSVWSTVQWKDYNGNTVTAPLSSGNPVDDGVQVIAADHVNGSSFYYLDTLTGTSPARVWVSSDRGINFAVPNGASTNLPGGMVEYSIKSQPGTAGSVWVAADRYPWARNLAKEGLYRSTDYGKTFTKLANVTRALSFGFGKEASASSPPTLYIYGRISSNPNFDGAYFSTDLGATWTSMANPANNVSDGPTIMEGSRKTYGRVFVGTGGRGIFYSK